jgi:hypothetical protein
MIKNTLLFVLVSLLAGCGGEAPRSCYQEAWQSGFLLSTELMLMPAQVQSAAITACRNGVCTESDLHGVTLPPLNHIVNVAFSTPSVSAELFNDGNGYKFGLTYAGSPDQLHDGDVYTITLRAPDGTTLFSTSQAVTYAQSEPNGPGCGVCAQAVVNR